MHMDVCLSSPILWACWSGQAVWAAGLSWACQGASHSIVVVGLIRSSTRMNGSCWETGTGRGGDVRRKMKAS